MYYLDEKPISSITHSVIRRLGLVIENTINVENVLSDFFVLHDDGYHHKRIDKELEHYHGICVINKDNGIKGGRPRKTHSVTDGNPMQTEANPIITLTKNHKPLTNNHNKSKDTSAPLVLLASLGVDGQLAKDFITLRKQKKASITETALKGICREASKANLTPMEAIQISCERGWAGFKAEWVVVKAGTVQEAQLDVARQIWGNQNGNDRSFIDIDSSGSIEGNGKDIPKTLAFLRESVNGEMEGN